MKELKNWFLKNIDIKLLSLFLAIILWLYIASGENPIVDNFIDVSLIQNNLSEDLVIKEFPTNVSMGIKGPKNIINNISSHQISGTVNFSEIDTEGLYKLKIEVVAPKGTQISRIIPPEIKVEVEKNTLIIISGIDKQAVGQFAAEVRAKKPPEPYKGKGIRYEEEFVRKKAGKAAKGKTA